MIRIQGVGLAVSLALALLVAAEGVAGAAQGDFVAAPTSPEAVGSIPSSLAVGDLDGDGHEDLAVANQESDNVTILLGDGGGDFAPAPTGPEAVGNSPASVAVGDLDGDADADLTVANTFSDNVTILLGDGTGDFTSAPSSPEAVGGWPVAVAVGKIDADGNSDLVVANWNDDSVSILRGSGSGDFSEAAVRPATGDAPNSVALGDVNGDSKLDLATANSGSGNATILLGNGTGAFAEPASSPEDVGEWPQSVVLANMSADQNLDLVTANRVDEDAGVGYLLGTGNGDFSGDLAAGGPAGELPIALAAGNLDGDSRLDLAVANIDSEDATILLGTQIGIIVPFETFFEAPSSPEPLGGSPNSIAVGDFNEDAKPDLAVPLVPDKVAILLNDPDLMPPETTIDSGPAAGSVTSQDDASFTYSGTPPDDTDRFECSLDGAGFAECPDAGQLYTDLSDGPHSFAVRAIDAVGNRDESPATRSWTVDTDPPGSSTAGSSMAGNSPAVGPPSPFRGWRFGRLRRNSKRGTALLTVVIPGPGEVVLAKTRNLRGYAARATDAGPVTLRIRPRGPARRTLRHRGRLEATAWVSFAAENGATSAGRRSLVLRLRR